MVGWCGATARFDPTKNDPIDPPVHTPPQVISCPPLFRRPWARQPTSTSFSTAWAYDVKEKLLLTNSHCVTDGVVINVRAFRCQLAVDRPPNSL